MAVQCKTKKIDPTAYSNQVDIISSEVRITQTCASGWAVSFKKLPASVRARFHLVCYNNELIVLDQEKRNRYTGDVQDERFGGFSTQSRD